jgi:DNA repair photolyase
MIISASRRTDIPSYYSEWFFNRIKEKSVCVRNHFNTRQISVINLDPELVDCIVFWSKNPKPMIDKLQLINDYKYFFQFTLNPYEQDIEARLPPKAEIIETFKKLSDLIGLQRVIWRYDPILINSKYNVAYHIEKFEKLANILKGYTEKVTISFIDFYKKIMEKINLLEINEVSTEGKNIIAQKFSEIAKSNNFSIDTCAEDIDLSGYGITNARCIDDRLISKITGCNLLVEKDKNQRLECGCVKSIDIGEYNSCSNGCVYCYANYSNNTVENNFRKHIQESPLLIGDICPDDVVKESKVTASGERFIQNPSLFC